MIIVVSHENTYQRETSAEKNYNNQVDKRTHFTVSAEERKAPMSMHRLCCKHSHWDRLQPTDLLSLTRAGKIEVQLVPAGH